MIETVIGIGMGVGLSALNLFAPKMGALGNVCSVLLAQSQFISPTSFLIGSCINAGLSGALTAINKYFNEERKEQLSTRESSEIANITCQSAAIASIPISIGIGTTIVTGGPTIFAGMSKAIALLSVPLTILLAVLSIEKMAKQKRLPYVIGVTSVTLLALGFIITTGNPLAMTAIAGVAFLGKPAKQQTHKLNKLSSKSGSMPVTNNMWISLLMSTIMIGLPTSSIWSLLGREEKTSDLEEECRKTMMEILSNHCSMLLFLMLGMARSGSANNLGIIVNSINPLTAALSLGLMVTVQIWSAWNLPYLTELYLTKRAKHNASIQWVCSISYTILTCLLIGLPLNVSLIFVGAGLLLSVALETLNIKESLVGMFSNIPLVGITLM